MKKDDKGYHILIVEDNFGDFVLIEEYLLDYILNPTLIHARSFQEAKLILEESKNTFDVVFLDLSLPDLSGEKLIVDTLEIANGMPVLALTGFSDLDFSLKSLALGVSDYLLKDELTPIILYKSIIYAIERNRHFDELQKSEKRYSELFHLSPLPMWVYDLETLAFLDVNQAAIQHYGFDRQDFLSKTLEHIRPSEDLPLLHNALKAYREGNSLYPKRVFRHVKKSGEIIKVEIESSAILFNQREAKLVLVNDITEKVQYIETIETQNRTFKEISWIQSHVVRAPLARLMGLVSLLESEAIESNPELNELLAHIKNSSIELDDIIRDISKKSESISPLDENDPRIANN
ncbi:MAG: PAS domain S-box protein [Algoriphagus sp.]|nr:PAS domain S-box protein [Algoriphagus sp.]